MEQEHWVRFFYEEFVSEIRKQSLTLEKYSKAAVNLRRATMPPSRPKSQWLASDIPDTLANLGNLASELTGQQRIALDAILTAVYNTQADTSSPKISSFLAECAKTRASACAENLK